MKNNIKEMQFQIEFCGHDMISNVLAFQQRHLPPDNPNISSPEFSCPHGLCAAVRRREVIVALGESKSVIGMARIYISKKNGNVSLYQFAIDPYYRKTGLLRRMLSLVSDRDVICRCMLDSKLNIYFDKMDWNLISQNSKHKFWCLSANSWRSDK